MSKHVPMASVVAPGALTVPEAAAYLRTSAAFIRTSCNTGKLPHARGGRGRKIIIDIDDLERFKKQLVRETMERFPR